MTPELALQKAIRNRLVSWPDVISLLPVTSILDRNERPNPTPSIVIGEGQSADEGDAVSRNVTRIYMDLHVWTKEPSLEGAKAIAGAIRAAMRSNRLPDTDGYHVVDAYVSGSRFMRDPDGITSHAVVTISARVQGQ